MEAACFHARLHAQGRSPGPRGASGKASGAHEGTWTYGVSSTETATPHPVSNLPVEMAHGMVGSSINGHKEEAP